MVTSEVAQRRVSLYSLNLLWAMPLAFGIGYVPASIVRFDRCGSHECLGEVEGFASPLAPAAVGVAILGALAMLGAVALIPRLRPVRLRLIIAFVVFVFVFVLWVWRILDQ